MNQYPYSPTLSETTIPDLDDYQVPAEPIELPVVEPVEEPAEVVEEVATSSDIEDDVAPSAGATKSAGSAKPSRALIRKIVAKTLEVESAPNTTRALTAALLGSAKDTAELTTAIMTAGRGVENPISDITEISTALLEQAWEAGIIATSLDFSRQKAVWSMLHALEAVSTPAPPKSLQKAGSAIVKAINGLTSDDDANLASVGELLKRS